MGYLLRGLLLLATRLSNPQVEDALSQDICFMSKFADSPLSGSKLHHMKGGEIPHEHHTELKAVSRRNETVVEEFTNK